MGGGEGSGTLLMWSAWTGETDRPALTRRKVAGLCEQLKGRSWDRHTLETGRHFRPRGLTTAGSCVAANPESANQKVTHPVWGRL